MAENENIRGRYRQRSGIQICALLELKRDYVTYQQAPIFRIRILQRLLGMTELAGNQRELSHKKVVSGVTRDGQVAVESSKRRLKFVELTSITTFVAGEVALT